MLQHGSGAHCCSNLAVERQRRDGIVFLRHSKLLRGADSARMTLDRGLAADEMRGLKPAWGPSWISFVISWGFFVIVRVQRSDSRPPSLRGQVLARPCQHR